MSFRHSSKIGFSFGITSGIITTLGLIVGLHSGTHSRLVIIGGILTIAVADAFSDALGIHISEESENKHEVSEIWLASISTFLTKFSVAMIFVIPMVLLPLSSAIIVSIIWGLLLLGVFSYYIAKGGQTHPARVIAEHLLIAVLVIIITHYIGDWIGTRFN